MFQKIILRGQKKTIDFKTIELLKKAIDITGAKIVVSSSWRNIRKYHGYGERLQLKHIKQIINRFGIMQKDEREDYNEC